MAERYPYSSRSETVDLLKYLWRFIAAYLAFAAVLALVTVMFDFKNMSALSVVVILASAQLAGYSFYKDHQRVPEKAEKRRFSLYTMCFSLLVSILPFAVLISSNETETMAIVDTLGYAGLGVALVVTSVLAYFLAAFGFAQGARLEGRWQAAKAKRGRI